MVAKKLKNSEELNDIDKLKDPFDKLFRVRLESRAHDCLTH